MGQLTNLATGFSHNRRQHAIDHCLRKRQQQHHHQRTSGSTNVKTFISPDNLDFDFFNFSTVF
jgi:hypothetical protein